ncbi:TonB-dependent receptor [Novosphingobium sp. RD2P27]|uniref:TonB-dependent receptor n=1 Tax=Novosphingobium kalidii TaxID=3230299 RepID=A0ABV2CXW1_9SPHN
MMTRAAFRGCAGRTAIAVSIVVGAGLHAPVYAQEGAPAPVAQVDNSVIIVTARRRAENLQDVPIAVTAVDAQTLTDLRVTKAEDLEALEPTFSVSPASGYVNKNVYSLRGIRPTEAIYGQDPTVAIYFADVVQSPAQGSNLGFYDLENVQILKGPQGTLFGRNTVGGAVLMTPRKPGAEFAVNGMVGFGEWGLFETELGIDIPLSPTFAVRLAGRTIDSDGYQTNVAQGPFFGTKLGGEETRSVRATIVGDLTDSIQHTLIATYDKKDTNGRLQVLQAVNPANNFIRCYDGPGNPVGGSAGLCAIEAARGLTLPSAFDAVTRAEGRDVHDVESDIPNYDNVEAWSVTSNTVAELSDNLTFKAILNYREVDSEAQIDLDSTQIRRILTSEDQTADLRHHSVELQLQGSSLADRLQWVLGGFYYHEQGTESSPGYFFEALLPGANPIEQKAIADNTSYSVFAQGSFKLTDQLTLTAGARMNWDRKKLTLLTKTAGRCALVVSNPDGTRAPLPNNACSLPLEDNFSQPTGTVSIDYKITPDLLVYATSRLGYRSGGFNLRADIPEEYEPFKPETVIDVEGGVKADYYVGPVRMRSNLAVYHQWYDDIQRTVAVENAGGSPGSSVVNAASATVFGIELQQSIEPVEGLTIDASYAFTKPEFEDYQDPFTMVDLSDTPFVFTPRHAVNLRATVEQPLSGDNGTLRLTGNAAWQDEVWINALHTSEIIAQHPPAVLPLLKQSAYWVFDFSAGWNNVLGSNFDLQAYVRNAFNEDYKVGGIQLYTGATGFIAAAYGPPRQAGVQLRFRF